MTVNAARAEAVSVDKLVADPLESILRESDLSPAQRAAAFRAWADSHPLTTPVLSDEAISREAIYSDRG